MRKVIPEEQVYRTRPSKNNPKGVRVRKAVTSEQPKPGHGFHGYILTVAVKDGHHLYRKPESLTPDII